MSSVRDWAHVYISRSWRPIPIGFRTKVPPKRFRTGWQNLAIESDGVERYFDGDSGIGILLGSCSGDLTDIDLDSSVARQLADIFLPHTDAVFGRAGSPSSHRLYYAKGSSSKKFLDPCAEEERACLLEIRSDGCQTVVPPSTHASGEAIVWVNDGEPATVDADFLRSRIECLAAATLLVHHFPSVGARDITAFALAGVLIRAGWAVEPAEEFIRIVAREGGATDVEAKVAKVRAAKVRFDRGEQVAGAHMLKEVLDWRIVDKVVGWLTPERETSPLAGDVRLRCTDVANAERFAKFAASKVRYCYPWKSFFVWTGQRWRREERGEVMRMAVEVAKGIHLEAASAADSHERTVLSKWALASENKMRLDAMVSVARSRLSIGPEELDAQPFDLNLENGTLDLRTGVIRPHDPEDLITRLVPIRYVPTSGCERWLAFLDEVMEGDAEMVRLLQLAAGYSLTGDTGEQCLFLLHGRGANGKSTFLEVLLAICGEYARPTDFRTLSMRTFGDAIRNDIAALRGLRMVSASETNRGRRFDEALVKQLTGSDKITARFLYAELFDFVPSFKIWLAANTLPSIDGTDDGIWRRIRVLPFRAQFTRDRRTKNLHEQMIAVEGQGILAWAVMGARRWLDEGLPVPQQVREATQAYRVQSDDVGAFIKAECVLPDVSTGDIPDRFLAAAGALLACYQDWCSDSGLEALKGNAFSAALQERGFRPASVWDPERRKQVRVYRGLKLAPERHKAF